jgi:hypothetical protein
MCHSDRNENLENGALEAILKVITCLRNPVHREAAGSRALIKVDTTYSCSVRS